MKKTYFFFLALAAMAASPAQNAAPKKDSDEDALRRAIEAVDRAKEKMDKDSASTPAAAPAARAVQPKTPPAVPSSTAAKTAAASRPAATATAAPKKQPASSDGFFTKIVGEDDNFIQYKEGIAIFRKNVEVDRPDLKIWCQELAMTMNRPEAGKTGKPAPAAKDDSGDAFSADNLKKAVAKGTAGSVVVIWRKTDKGEILANCREAIYDGATGNIVLKGKPEVLQNLQQFAFGKTDDATLTLYKNGNIGGKFGVEHFQEPKGLEVRRRLLSSVPPKKKEAVESIDVPVPPPAAETNENSSSN